MNADHPKTTELAEAPPMLPSAPATVAMFLASEANNGTAPSTLNRRLSAIRLMHLGARVVSPHNAVEIQEVMRGIRRLSTRGVVKKEAAGDEQIKTMVDTCDAATYQGQRDRALLLFGFAGALRRSELVALDVAHLKVSDEGFVVTIAKSMPFSHIMAGSYNFNNALRVGATINLDEGKPIPHLFPVTVANL